MLYSWYIPTNCVHENQWRWPARMPVLLTNQVERKKHAVKKTTLKTRGSAHWACITHLTIEWYWSKFQSEIIITLKNSSHLEWRVGLSDTILKGTHPGTIYAKFGSIRPSCFRGEDFFNISQSEKRINLGSHVCRPNGLNGETL